MFWILKIFPEWFWWLMFVTGLFGYFLSHLPTLKPYELLVKIIGVALVALSIFIFGLQHADTRWQQAALELEAKVAVAEAASKTINAQIETKTVVRTQVVKQRGETVVKYIDREVVKLDQSCVIPPEFVNAHNQAAIP